MKLQKIKSEMKEGVFLEMMVECFQKLFASDEISVSRNKKYYSKGKLIGEVDVVIEGFFNSKYIKIGTECRDRKGAQGRNWIRQIIGKRFDLAEFGFTDWIAISSGGFRSTAEELANKGNIRLLVPGSMMPVEPEKPGPHQWMRLDLDSSWKVLGRLKAKIGCEENVIDWVTNQINIDSGKTVFVVISNSETIPLSEFINIHADIYLEELKKNTDKDFKEIHTFKFKELNAIVENVPFKFNNFEIDVTFFKKTYKSKFGMTVFGIPNTNKVLGFIGLNEYQNHVKIKYLMFAMKQGDLNNAVMAIRDSKGDVIKNQEFTFIFSLYSSNVSTQMLKIKNV